MNMAPGTLGTMSTQMDRLVAAARSSRDAAFNSLDATDRQTRAASERLRQEIEQFFLAHPSAPPPDDGAERDARFDPEDEWDLPRHEGPTMPTAHEDDDDYPPTWLR
jgi:hypothetical protein